MRKKHSFRPFLKPISSYFLTTNDIGNNYKEQNINNKNVSVLNPQNYNAQHFITW